MIMKLNLLLKFPQTKIILNSLLLLGVMLISSTVKSQEFATEFDRVYGLDQLLCNGKKYIYKPPPGTQQHQFLFSPGYISGSLTISGKTYSKVSLNYDVFNQELLLRYVSESGSVYYVEVSKAWLSGFSLDSLNFELLSVEKDPHFYQVIGTGGLRILFYYRKNLELDGAVGNYVYHFTHAIRDSFILIDNKLKPFNSTRSMVKQFNPEQRAQLKSYLRKNKVNVKKASDRQMTDMINFIDNLK